jgi:LysM repeat protein
MNDSITTRSRWTRLLSPLTAGACALVTLIGPVPDVSAGTKHEEIVKSFTRQQRREFANLQALSPSALAEISDQASAEHLERQTRAILDLGPLSIGGRAHDKDGLAPIHHHVLDRIRSLESKGVEFVGSMRGTVAAPVPATPGRVTVDGQSWTVHPFWPNGAMPSLCPKQGLRGPMVYVGRADWSDIDGLDLHGAIALMNLEGGRNWEELFSLGAQAVVVIEDDFVTRQKTELMFCNTPVPFPRFYVDRATGNQLIALATRKNPDAAASSTVIPGKTALLEGGQVFERRPWESIFAWLPPTAPVTYEVRAGDLLQRIASDFGVTADELRQVNQTDNAPPVAGHKLAIPRSASTYTVAANDLAQRIAADYGISVSALFAANNLAGTPDLTGLRLAIPNLDGALALFTRLDSVSSVPDLPHGTLAAANLATALTALDHLASTPNIVRRKGILFAFIDGDTLGGVGSRAFAEHTLRADDQLTASVARQKEEQNIFPILAIALGAAQLALIAWIVFHYRHRTVAVRLTACALVIVTGSAGIVAAQRYTRTHTGDDALADPVARYRAALDWFTTPDASALHPKQAEWLAQEWLGTALEQYRVDIAKERTTLIIRQNAEPNPVARRTLDASIAEASDKLRRLMQLRRATIENRNLDWPARVNAFRHQLEETHAQHDASPVNLAQLRDKLHDEYQETAARQSITRHNIALVTAVRRKLQPVTDGKPAGPVAGWFLDLSDGTPSLGINATAYRVELPAKGHIGHFTKRFRGVVAHASVQAGWRDEWTFLTDLDRNDQVILQTPASACYAEFWAAGNIGLLPLFTVNDNRQHLDTPRDVPQHTNFRHLSLQARNVLLLARLGVENQTDSQPPSRLDRGAFSQVIGRAVEFNIRSGIDAKQPIPGACAYYPSLPRLINRPAVANAANTSTHNGVRTGTLQFTAINGQFHAPLEALAYNPEPPVYVYQLDRDRALFAKVLEQSIIGTQPQTAHTRLTPGREVEKNLVLTDVYPRVFFPGTDPADYGSIGGSKIDLLDAVTRGQPSHYALEAASKHFGESEIMSIVMYLAPGRRAQVIVKQALGFKLLLVGPATAESPRGSGYYIGPLEDGDRNLTIPMTPLAIARDTQRMAQDRLDLYRRFGISNHAVENAVARSAEKIAAAQQAADARQWQVATGASREAWGTLIRYYPRIMQLAREAVFSMVILMALLVPACVFLEQLLIGGKSIVAHLAGATSLFVACTVYLKYLHPAFQISVSPFIVMIAFLMILMAVVVLVICYQRFEVLVRRARIAGGEAESEEISLASSLATALNLGVSNLKKRMTRTALTAMTVSVLTFSIVAFVSVKGQDTLVKRAVTLDDTVAGEPVEPLPPAYDGVMFRNIYWIALGKDFVSSISSEFGTQFEIATRGHYIDKEGGGGATMEGANQLEVRAGGKSVVLTGLMAYEPKETRFSQLNRAVTHGRWLPDPATDEGRDLDRFVVILPDVAARELGITEGMIFDETQRLRPPAELPQVRMMNLNWRVVGILDTRQADRMRDINGKSLAMVDYRASAFSSSVGTRADVLTEPPSQHLKWKDLAIVPLAATGDLRSTPLYRSVVIRFGDASPDQVDRFFKDVALRLNRSMFVSQNGELSLVSARTKQSVAGVAKVIVPVILCILIVSNTMMGNVEERKGEVAMLGAVGLSPRQISFLLLSESTVFSVIGIVFGTFAGLLFANLVPWVSANFGGLLGGLSFNFTSMTAVALALATGLVVLMATLLPARKAAAVAAPSGMARWQLPAPSPDGRIQFDLPFTMTRGNTVGMLAFFRRFLLNHTEATSQDFNCRNIAVTQETGDEDLLRVRADMWLSPYDLDVSQQMTLDIHTTETPGVFRVRICLARTSGTEEAWMRTNYGFMDLVRQQFLLWRNLDHQARETYIEAGVALFRSSGAQPAADR